MIIEEYQRLKVRVDELTRKHNEAEGMLKAEMKNLREKFKCQTIEQAEERLSGLEEKERELKEQLKEEEEAFLEKWQDVLEELDND